jgi:TatD DNase family protein
MYIDTHSHLHAEEFSADRDDVIQRAIEAGIETIVLIGENIADSRLALDYCRRSPLFRAVVGVHPHKASEWNPEAAATLQTELAVATGAVAIGEIGLDYHYDFAPRDKQHEAFLAQSQTAQTLRKPVVIHCREAYDDLLDIWSSTFHPTNPIPNPGVLHCYFGTVAQARRAVDMGFYLGIGGACTFKKAEELHEVIRQMPLDRMVLETDAPYMAPVPHRGKRNESAYIPLIAARIAELKGLHLETVASQTTQNARALYSF